MITTKVEKNARAKILGLKFKCICCGECCRRISDEDSSAKGLPLFEWEVGKIKELATEKKIPIKIEPIDLVFDKKSGEYFCTGYTLVSEPCVFLDKCKCSIHKERPIFCRAFPVARNPEFLDDVPDLACFSKCPNFDFKAFLRDSLGLVEGKPFTLSRKKINEEYTKTFDEEIMKNSFVRDSVLSFFDETMAALSEEGLIDIELVDRVPEGKRVIPFLQFLVKNEFIGEKEKEKLIEDWKN